VHAVRLYFDFLSPYSALALLRAERFAAEHGVRWAMRPVVLAALLDHAGLPGGAEVAAKRAFVAQDVVRCAEAAGIALVGPPEVPFLSLDALRAAALFADDERCPAICAAIARAGWCAGRDLTDVGVLAAAVAGAGADAAELPARIRDRAVKRRLQAFTAEAIEAGAFGVPTFVWEHDGGRELFWGQDRMDQLAARLAGSLGSPRARADALLAKPVGFDRRKLAT
jgi:2-hydroxychromene-2-carboxylate isomerase